MIPKIYSNDCMILDSSNENPPINLFIFLDDWTGDDCYDYLDALEDSGLVYVEGYGYVISENLYINVAYNSGYGAAIHIYHAVYSPVSASDDWPVDVINDFYGEELGATIPAFESDDVFTFDVFEDTLTITTECSDPLNKMAAYLDLLEGDGWEIDGDNLFLWGMATATSPDGNIFIDIMVEEDMIIWTFYVFE